MSKNFTKNNRLSNVLHILIIAVFLLGLHGCGYKGAPIYTGDSSVGDENVSFKIRKVNVDTNTSATCEKEK